MRACRFSRNNSRSCEPCDRANACAQTIDAPRRARAKTRPNATQLSIGPKRRHTARKKVPMRPSSPPHFSSVPLITNKPRRYVSHHRHRRGHTRSGTYTRMFTHTHTVRDTSCRARMISRATRSITGNVTQHMRAVPPTLTQQCDDNRLQANYRTINTGKHTHNKVPRHFDLCVD